MADLLSAMRELRYLDEKRLLGPLAPAEESRWEELRALVNPQAPAPAAPATPAPVVPAYQSAPAPEFIPTGVYPPAPEVTEVEPPFVDAELTEEVVAGPSDEPLAPTALSAFDKPPIPQAPAGQEPMLLDLERPQTDFETTNAGQSERPESDFEATAVAVADPFPGSDYEQTVVAPIPLTSMAPPAEAEAPTFGRTQTPAFGFEPEAPPPVAHYEVEPPAGFAAPPAEEPPPVEEPPAPVIEPTAVVPLGAVPWRASPTLIPDPVPPPKAEEHDVLALFGEQGRTAPSTPKDVITPVLSDDLLGSWPRAQALPNAPPAVPTLKPEGAAPAPSPESIVAPYVTGLQRVVVHTLEGLQTRGYLSDADLTRGAILLRKQDGTEQWFNVEELKAVFFLVPPDQEPSAAQGTHIAVTLRDGRTLHGTALDPSGQGVGFFLFPSDGNSRVDRIFIYLQAIKDIAPA